MAATLALVGNPNVGKTAVFNALTGLAHATGNYPGVTVDRKHGLCRLGDTTAELVDLPGTYSLAARSPDEIIVADVLLDQQRGEKPIDGLVVVLDASNLERNLYLLSQLLELEKPVVVALNMMDIAERRGLRIDIEQLSSLLGTPVVPICAHKNKGIAELKTALAKLAEKRLAAPASFSSIVESQRDPLERLSHDLADARARIGRPVPRLECYRLLIDEGGYAEQRLAKVLDPAFTQRLQMYRKLANGNCSSLAAQEARARYAWVRSIMDAAVQRPAVRQKTPSERIDNLLTHKVTGTLFFLGLMMLVFQFIYSWAQPVMGLVDATVAAIGERLAANLPDGVFESLLVDGVISGVGAVLIFMPQILILSLFIAILEDCGYMARAAFLMDRLLGWCGLSGQSFIPMLSSFACAIPGVLATRTIHNRRDRFTTILVAPLMSCSARLPVYLIMIAAFIPNTKVAGFVGLQGLTLFLVYCVGILVAVPVAWTLKKTLFRGEKPPFILEMPSYKAPQAKTVAQKVYREGRAFITRAGTLILAVTIVIWALAYFPRSPEIEARIAAQQEALAQQGLAAPELEAASAELDHELQRLLLENSFLGRFGQAVAPLFAPLGWDWRIATATLSSFPAREIVVATLGTLFNMGSETDETDEGFIETLKGATWSGTDRPLFTIPVALSIMVFFALCCQCFATLATIKRETRQWRWPMLTFGYMTVLAYGAAFLCYHGAAALGW